MPRETAADRIAAHALIGCEPNPTFLEDRDVCPWEGVVEIQYFNADGPTWRSCRAHAAPYRYDKPSLTIGPNGKINPDEYRVTDSGRNNRRLLPETFLEWKVAAG